LWGDGGDCDYRARDGKAMRAPLKGALACDNQGETQRAIEMRLAGMAGRSEG